MSLTPALRQQLRLAIQRAFNYDELRLAVGEGDWQGLHNVRLEEFVDRDPMNIVASNLVAWAEKNGRVRVLYEICLAANPGNPGLAQLATAIRALQEVPKPAEELASEVALDDKTYTIPTRPLTQQQRQLIAGNLGLAAVNLLGTAGWTSIFIDGAWIFWLTTFGLGVLSKGWDLLGNQVLQSQVFSLFRSTLTNWGTLAVLAVYAIVAGGLSLTISKVWYDGEKEDPNVVIESKTLEPGDQQWLWIPPNGRKMQFATSAYGYYRDFRVCPWRRTTLKPTLKPYVIIEPADAVLRDDISEDETDPQLQWRIRVTRAEVRLFEDTAPYFGAPLAIHPEPDDRHEIPEFVQRRNASKHPIIHKVADIRPGEKLQITLSSDTTYTTEMTVENPPKMGKPFQLVKVPPQQ